MMLLRRWAGGGVYWRKRKRSFCHLINGILMIADSQLTRKAPASYSDGVYRMSGHSRPSPRSISQELMKGSDGLASRRNRTALHTFFGKFLSFQYQKGSKCAWCNQQFIIDVAGALRRSPTSRWLANLNGRFGAWPLESENANSSSSPGNCLSRLLWSRGYVEHRRGARHTKHESTVVLQTILIMLARHQNTMLNSHPFNHEKC